MIRLFYGQMLAKIILPCPSLHLSWKLNEAAVNLGMSFLFSSSISSVFRTRSELSIYSSMFSQSSVLTVSTSKFSVAVSLAASYSVLIASFSMASSCFVTSSMAVSASYFCSIADFVVLPQKPMYDMIADP